MRLRVEFYMDAEWVDSSPDPSRRDSPLGRRVEASVAEAVNNAVLLCQGNGFAHDLESFLSVMLNGPVKARLVPPPDEVARLTGSA